MKKILDLFDLNELSAIVRVNDLTIKKDVGIYFDYEDQVKFVVNDEEHFISNKELDEYFINKKKESQGKK